MEKGNALLRHPGIPGSRLASQAIALLPGRRALGDLPAGGQPASRDHPWRTAREAREEWNGASGAEDPEARGWKGPGWGLVQMGRQRGREEKALALALSSRVRGKQELYKQQSGDSSRLGQKQSLWILIHLEVKTLIVNQPLL